MPHLSIMLVISVEAVINKIVTIIDLLLENHLETISLSKFISLVSLLPLNCGINYQLTKETLYLRNN